MCTVTWPLDWPRKTTPKWPLICLNLPIGSRVMMWWVVSPFILQSFNISSMWRNLDAKGFTVLCETATAIGPVACILVTNRTNAPELGLGKIMMLYYLDQDKAPILQQYFPSGRCIFVEMMEAERTRYFYFYTTTIHTNTVIRFI